MNLLFMFLLTLPIFSQTVFKDPECKNLDPIACNKIKIEESKRVNLLNANELKKALSSCSPIKIPTYYIDKLVRNTEVHGKENGKCKMTITSEVEPKGVQTCLLDEPAINLMRKDPKTYTPEDKAASSRLFNEQCSGKFLDQKVQKEHKELQKGLAAAQEKMKKTMIDNMRSEVTKLKQECSSGNKKACSEYDTFKKDLDTNCKKPENTENCKLFEGI